MHLVRSVSRLCKTIYRGVFMKRRFVSLFMVLILAVPLLLVGVSAAGDVPAQYVFQYDLETGLFCCPFVMASGSYKFSFFGVDFGVIDIVYESSSDGLLMSYHVIPLDDTSTLEFGVSSLDFVGVGSFIDVVLDGAPLRLDPDQASDPLFLMVFVPVSQDSFEGLGSFLSTDSFSVAMDEILILIPVVLGVTVSYIGIRKGIAWLMQVLRNS